MSKIAIVGICGFRTVGAGLAEVCARFGFNTVILTKSQDHASDGLARVEKSSAKAQEGGKMTPRERKELLHRIHVTQDISDLSQCDIVLESVTEDISVKRVILQDLDAVCEPKTIFASTTSSLSITQLASMTSRPAQIVGMHFFNPVPIMQLVEIARGKETSQEVVETTKAFAESLGKVTLVMEDQVGLLVNRLLFAYLLDAIKLLESGMAKRDDIDTAMELGCSMPLGPLKLIDLVGLDSTIVIADNLYQTDLTPKK